PGHVRVEGRPLSIGVRVRQRITHLLHSAQRCRGRSGGSPTTGESDHIVECREVEEHLAAGQIEGVAIEYLAVVRKRSVINKADARVACTKVEQEIVTHYAIIIQPPGDRVDERTSSLCDYLWQAIGVSIGSGILTLGAGSRPVEREFVFIVDAVI